MIYKMAQNEDFQVQTKSGGIVNVPSASGDTELVTKKEADEGWWSEWVCEPSSLDGSPIIIASSESVPGALAPFVNDIEVGRAFVPGDLTSYTWLAHDEWDGDEPLTATRHRVLGLSSETWTFVLDGGTTVTKSVYVG